MKIIKSTQNIFNNWIFTSKVLNALPTESRDRLNKIKKTALMVALIDGLLFGAAMYSILGVSFLLSTLGMIVIVLLIESFFLSSGATGKGMRIARFAIAAVIVACHSLILDSWVMQRDIENHFAEGNQHQSVQIDSTYEQKKQGVTAQITDLRTQNDSLRDIQKKWSDRLYAEINVGSGQRSEGYGIVARKYESLSEKDAARIAPIITANDNAIMTLEADIDTLRAEQAQQKSKLIAPKNRGLMERIEAVAVIVFKKGNHHAMIAYILMFLLMLTLELLPLMQKFKNQEAYESYDQEARRQSQEDRDKQMRGLSFQRLTEQKLEEHYAKIDLEKQLKEQEHNHLQTLQRMEQNHVDELAKNEFDHEARKKHLDDRANIRTINDFTEPDRRGPGRPRKD